LSSPISCCQYFKKVVEKRRNPFQEFDNFSRRIAPCFSLTVSHTQVNYQRSPAANVCSFPSVMFSSYRFRSSFRNSILSSVFSHSFLPPPLQPSSSSSLFDQSDTSSSTMKPCSCKLCCLVILALLAISASRATLETSKLFVVSPCRSVLS